MATQPKTLISVDVETTGSYPPKNSMLSLGAVAFSFPKGVILDHFSKNLHELPGSVRDAETMRWWKTEQRAWKKATKLPLDPRLVIRDFVTWMAQFPRPKILAAPVAYDGMYLRWYLERYAKQYRNSLAWHNMFDLRTTCFCYTGQYNGNYRALVRSLTGEKFTNPSPHVAVCDAEEQGRIFMSLIRWARKEGRLVPFLTEEGF